MAALEDLVGMRSTSSTSSSTNVLGIPVTTGVIAQITRDHDSSYSPEIADVESIVKELNVQIGQINTSSTRAGGKPFYSRKTLSKTDVNNGFIKRAANKAEKDELAKWLVDQYKKDATLQAKVYAVCVTYGKTFSLSMAKNRELLEEAKKKAKEAGFEPVFFAQNMGDYLGEFVQVILPIMKKAKMAGHNLKFFTWGTMLESFKDDLKAAITALLQAPESLRLLYSKVAAYGLNVQMASVISLRIIKSVCMLVVHAVEENIIDRGLIANQKLSNKDVMEHIRGKVNPRVLALELTDEQLKASRETVIKDEMSIAKAAMIAAGIPPHWTMQSFEYKQASSGTVNREVLAATFRSVSTNFNTIRSVYCHITGEKKVYSTTKFKDCVRECYIMWRPMFVVARVLRSYYYPQAQYGINENVDLGDFVTLADLNNDIDVTAMFK